MTVLKCSIGFNHDKNTYMTWKGSNLAKIDKKVRFFCIWGYFLSPQMDKRAYYEQNIIIQYESPYTKLLLPTRRFGIIQAICSPEQFQKSSFWKTCRSKWPPRAPAGYPENKCWILFCVKEYFRKSWLKLGLSNDTNWRTRW